MLIQNISKYVSQINFGDTVHKVIEGIADVPQEVRDHLVSFPEWSDVVDKVDDKVLKALDKARKETEKQNVEDNTDKTE